MKTITILCILSCSLIGSPIPDFPFIYVKGHASEEVPTTLATIRFYVTKNSRNSTQGESDLSDASKATRQALRDLGVKDKEIDSSQVSKRESYEEFPQALKQETQDILVDPSLLPGAEPIERKETKDKEIFYTHSQTFVLTITDLKIYPSIARYLMRSNDVSHYSVDFSATNRAEVMQRLRLAAFSDAKRAAKDIADASGETLGRIHSASEMPYSHLGNLIGEDSDARMYAMSGNTDPIYEVPPTVSEYFNIIVLYRLDQTGTQTSEQNAPSNR